MNRTWSRRCAVALATALAGGTLAACGDSGGSGSGSSTSGQTATPTDASIASVTWALPAPIRSLDYTRSADSGTATVVSLGCEQLVQYAPDGSVVPNLAESVETPDATTYVYKIRSGVTFWDGAPLTTGDVVYSLKSAADARAGSQIAALFSSVRSIEATGDDTVTVKLKAPDPFFKFTPAVSYIVQRRYAEEHRRGLGGPQALTMCTGPYRFTRYVPEERVELEAFDGYWGEQPNVKSLTLRFIVDDSTRLLAMRQGEIDGTFRIPQDQIDQWKKLSDVTIETAPEIRTAFLSLDMDAEPWNDEHVRRAVTHALDREGLVQSVLRGYGEPAVALAPPEQWGELMSPGDVREFYASLPQFEYDLEQARAELEQSAFPDGFSAEITYPDSQKTLGKIAQVWSESLAQIGIDLKVRQVPASEYFARLYEHPAPMGLTITTFGVDYPDPADFPAIAMDSRNAVANSFNLANYRSDEIDRLLKVQRETNDPAERTEAIKQLFEVAAQDLAYVPVWYQQMAMAIKAEYTYGDFTTWYVYTPWARNIAVAG